MKDALRLPADTTHSARSSSSGSGPASSPAAPPLTVGAFLGRYDFLSCALGAAVVTTYCAIQVSS